MKPKLIIDNEVFRKVMHWIEKSQYEVSGLGTVIVEPDGVLRVVSAMLLPQKNGHTHTDIEAEEVNKALYELRNQPGHLRWWWHSHVNMNVFWSGTDMETIKKIGEGGWFSCSVFNKKREVKSAYYGQQGQVTPWGSTPLFLDDLVTEVTPFLDPQHAAWDEEYELNVTNVRTPVTNWNERTGYEWQDREDYGGKKDESGDAKEKSIVAVTGTKEQGFEDGQVKKVVDMDIYDDWGFTQEDRQLLAKCGIEEAELEYMLIEQDWTPNEILKMAESSLHREDEIIDPLDENDDYRRWH